MTLGRKILAYMSPGLAIAMLSGFSLLIALNIYCTDWVISLISSAAKIIFDATQSILLGIGVSGCIFMVFRAMSWPNQPKTKKEAIEKAQDYFWIYVVVAGLAIIWTLEDNPQFNPTELGFDFIGLVIGGLVVAIFTVFYSLRYQLPPLYEAES